VPVLPFILPPVITYCCAAAILRRRRFSAARFSSDGDDSQPLGSPQKRNWIAVTTRGARIKTPHKPLRSYSQVPYPAPTQHGLTLSSSPNVHSLPAGVNKLRTPFCESSAPPYRCRKSAPRIAPIFLSACHESPAPERRVACERATISNDVS